MIEYELKISIKILYTLIFILLGILLFIIFPRNFSISLIIILILTIPLILQYFYSGKFITDSKAIHTQFKLFNKQHKISYLWTDINIVRYKSKKVYLYDKNSKRIFRIGREIKNFENLCIVIKRSISNENVFDKQFIDFVRNIK